MSTVQSLEQERQAILDRMQMRRETYRRMLADGEDPRMLAETHEQYRQGHGDGRAGESAANRAAHADPRSMKRFAAAGVGDDSTVYTYRRVNDSFPRTRVMQVVAEHPVLCALGAAAVLAIGPRRIMRTVATSSAAIGAVAQSPTAMDMIGRVLTLAGAVAQRRNG
ncbi:MAG TPA: hypothetical protein VM406_16535 [Noviherbaspirillum sp.]|nr:hypothetical protein [Noviherbaspirillum sp.]